MAKAPEREWSYRTLTAAEFDYADQPTFLEFHAPGSSHFSILLHELPYLEELIKCIKADPAIKVPVLALAKRGSA